MIPTRAILGFAVMAFVVAVPVAHSQDLDALKASFAADLRLFNSRNPDAFVASAHDGIVVFGILSPFPLDGKQEVRKVIQQYMEDNERVTFTPTNPDFRITGTTAIAWGHYTLTSKPKNGPLDYVHGRYTFTYTQSEEKWLLVGIHLSPLQPTFYM